MIEVQLQLTACPTDDEFSATIAKLEETANTTDLCRQMLYSSWNSVAQLKSALHQTREGRLGLANAYAQLQETHRKTLEELERLKEWLL
jgi:hypothetical protein